MSIHMETLENTRQNLRQNMTHCEEPSDIMTGSLRRQSAHTKHRAEPRVLPMLNTKCVIETVAQFSFM